LALIEFKNVYFQYANSEKFAVEDISLSISEGEFVLITGPSGCGKTTICRAMNGLVPHFHKGKMKGEVIVDGLKTTEHEVSKLATKVGLVFQNPENQLVALNVEREIAFGPENLGLPPEEIRKRVEDAISLVGIEKIRHRAPYEISGGQQQLVALASVISLNPKVLVLDEPTAHLDPKAARMVLKIVKKLNNELGTTIVLVEHRLDLSIQYATRMILMDKGKIVLDGSPRDILTTDITASIGVGEPKVVQLFKALQKHGVRLPVPLTPEEAGNYLKEMIKQHDNNL